ncbi:MAG: pyrroline-5-carboxylate reductase [Candidatus Margulisiibacteriota bacterium]
MRIAFIGAGKMAEALISRLGQSAGIIISDINPRRLKLLSSRYKAKIAGSNIEAFRSADVVILAVKPQNFPGVMDELRGTKLIISIAAGIPLSYLQKKLPGCAVIRAMPNNPALVGHGITALARGKGSGEREMGIAKKLFATVGEVIEVPEKWMDAVTGLSGSGPAFVYEVIEALTRGGMDAGLPGSTAAKLALQTVLGAAETVKQTGYSPRQLCQMVSSPGGTTIEGLKVLERGKVKSALSAAVVAAARKSGCLSKQWAT